MASLTYFDYRYTNNYSKNKIIYRKKTILSQYVLYVVHSETVCTFYLGKFFFPFKMHYLMSYSIWLCSKRIIIFSTSQIFHVWNKVCEEKGKCFFFCITVYYPPLHNYKLYIYRVRHLRHATYITQPLLVTDENLSNKSCLAWRGT